MLVNGLLSGIGMIVPPGGITTKLRSCLQRSTRVSATGERSEYAFSSFTGQTARS